MTKFAIPRWLKAVGDMAEDPMWTMPASVIEELEQQRDGAYAAEMHALQRAEQAEKERDQARSERDHALAANLLLCACTTQPASQSAGTPIGDALAAEKQYAGWMS